MAQAYCFKCQARREMKAPEEYSMRNGHPAVRGRCSVCDTMMSRRGTLAQAQEHENPGEALSPPG
jgi:hypothetical protein